MEVDHGLLDEVGRGALHGGIHGLPLRLHPDLEVLGPEVGQAPQPAEQGAHVAGLPGLRDRVVDEPPHRRIAGEVGHDERLRLLLRHPDVLGEGEGALPVEERVVDHLGHPALLVRGEGREGTEDLAGGAVVHVLPAPEGVDEGLVLREVGQDPELDLAVVGGEEQVPRLRHERLADAPPLRGADRDVLQVRVGGRDAAGGGHRLVERGVDASGLGVHELGQCVHVGRLELLDGPVLQDLAGELVDEGQLLQHVLRGGGGPGLGRLLAGLQAQPVEEHFPELDRRVDVELALGQDVDVPGEGGELPFHVPAHGAQQVAVDLHPRPLHVREHVDEGQLHGLVDGGQAFLLEALRHRSVEAQYEVGVAPRGARGLVGRSVVAAHPFRPRAALLAQELEGEVVQGIGAAAGVDQVGGHDRVEADAAQLHPLP